MYPPRRFGKSTGTAHTVTLSTATFATTAALAVTPFAAIALAFSLTTSLATSLAATSLATSLAAADVEREYAAEASQGEAEDWSGVEIDDEAEAIDEDSEIGDG